MATDTTKIKQMIIRIASEEGVDPALALAVAENESGFNPNAHNKTSKEDSYGIFQINKKAHPDYTGGFNPEQNIRYGVKFLKGQLARANGNPQVALAAYNGGWGGRNSTQAKGYAQRVLGIANKKYDKVSKNAAQIATNYNDAVKAGIITGAASGLNVPNPKSPDYISLLRNAEQDPTGQSKAQLTQREAMALRNMVAPITPIQDVRSNVTVGQDEQGRPITVSQAEYNDMLNQIDMQNMLALNQQRQQTLSGASKAEVQLGGQSAYDTMLGLRDEYNRMVENDPRAQLMQLTPEQARIAASDLRNNYNWGGNPEGLSRVDMYKMLNALDNQNMGYNDAMQLATDRHNRQLANQQQFMTAALTLAGNNKDLANQLMTQAVNGNGKVIEALQKTMEARMKAEADYQKEMQSGYNTLMNTQRQGLNTYYNNLPQTEANAVKNFNDFRQNVYNTQAGIYGTDVGATTKLLLPEVQANAAIPLETAKLQQNQQKIGIQQQNANTAQAVGAGSIISNATFNPTGFNNASQNVPAIRNVLGQPTTETSQNLFGLAPKVNNNPPALMNFLNMLRSDD